MAAFSEARYQELAHVLMMRIMRFYLSLHHELGRHIIGSSRIRTICGWAETSEVLFHGLQAAGSKPKAAKVDEGWLESRSASSVSALEPGPYGVGSWWA